MPSLNPTEVSGPTPIHPQIASLDNPLYYLENALTVVTWVMTYHGDLLTDTEMARLDQLISLPRTSLALLVRLVMRSGNLFRLERLNYPELGQTVAAALAPLVNGGWIDPEPSLSLREVYDLLRREELVAAFAQELKSATCPTAGRKTCIQTSRRFPRISNAIT